MKWLTSKQLMLLHEKLTKATGGGSGIRDFGLLESALSQPLSTFGGEDLYPETFTKCVRLGYGLVCNHPFVDGNKRIGALAMLVSLYQNGFALHIEDDAFAALFFDVAAGKVTFEQLLTEIKNLVC